MDDALQEAYLRAYAGLPRFSGRSRFATWMYRVAYNACVDELRRSRSDDLSLAETDLPHQQAADTTTRVGLAEALAALPAELRALVLLVDSHGLAYGEAAEVLGIPPGTVASRLSRARNQLRECLQEVEIP